MNISDLTKVFENIPESVLPENEREEIIKILPIFYEFNDFAKKVKGVETDEVIEKITTIWMESKVNEMGDDLVYKLLEDGSLYGILIKDYASELKFNKIDELVKASDLIFKYL